MPYIQVHIIRDKNISPTDRAPGLKSFYACKKRKISSESKFMLLVLHLEMC